MSFTQGDGELSPGSSGIAFIFANCYSHVRGKWCKKPAKCCSHRSEHQHCRLPFRHGWFWWWLSQLRLQHKKFLACYWTRGLTFLIFILGPTAIKYNNNSMKACIARARARTRVCAHVFPPLHQYNPVWGCTCSGLISSHHFLLMP